MARKGQKIFEPYSVGLEDELLMNFTVVGTKEWVETAIEPDALYDDEKLIISSAKDLLPIKEQIRKMKILGVDTETTGPIDQDKSYSMNPVNPDTKVVTLQLGNEEHVWVIQPDFIEEFKDIIEDEKQLHLAHHWLYDFKFLLTKYNIHPMRMYCSMLAEQVLTAGLMGRKVGLADCARNYPPHFLISKAVRTLFVSLNNGVMSRDMIVYAARDIPLLFPVYNEQVKELQRHKLIATAQLEFDVIPCTAEMELGGVYLDLNKLSLLIKYWVEKQSTMEDTILKLYSARRKKLGGSNFIIPELNEVFDLGSNKDKIEALRKIGITLDDVKRATLLSVEDPIAKLMGEYSGITKMTSTYGDNMLRKINSTTGMWHPRFAQCGAGVTEGESSDKEGSTATGRFVSNAQQFPKKQERYAFELDEFLVEQALVYFADEIKLYSKVNKNGK